MKDKIEPIVRSVSCCPGDCLTIYDQNKKPVAALKVDAFCELLVEITPLAVFKSE